MEWLTGSKSKSKVKRAGSRSTASTHNKHAQPGITYGYGYNQGNAATRGNGRGNQGAYTYDPYAASKSTNLSGSSRAAASSRSFVRTQKQVSSQERTQVTADRQMLLDAVTDTFEAVLMPAEAVQESRSSVRMVNSLTDAAVMSLGHFAGCAADYYKDKDMDSIKVAKKQLIDLFEELKVKSPKTYKMTEKHRALMFAALDGQKGLKYEEKRQDASKPDLWKQTGKKINEAFGHIIKSNQEFAEKQEAYLDPSVNAELRRAHDKKLAEFADNKKYGTYGHSQAKKFEKPEMSSLYFTESGKQSAFQPRNGGCTYVDEKDADDDMLGEALHPMGVQDGYDELPQDMAYPSNAAIKVLAGDGVGVTGVCPCEIFYPHNMATLSKIRIRLAKPFSNFLLSVPAERLIVDPAKVRSFETRWMASKRVLGYDSIDEIDECLMVID